MYSSRSMCCLKVWYFLLYHRSIVLTFQLAVYQLCSRRCFHFSNTACDHFGLRNFQTHLRKPGISDFMIESIKGSIMLKQYFLCVHDKVFVKTCLGFSGNIDIFVQCGNTNKRVRNQILMNGTMNLVENTMFLTRSTSPICFE